MSTGDLTTSLNKGALTITVKNGSISLEIEKCEGDTLRFAEAITDYITKFNKKQVKVPDDHEEYTCYAYICFHKPTTLHSLREKSYLFSQDLLFKHEGNQHPVANDKRQRPIIHLTTYKEDSKKDQKDSEAGEKDSKKEEFYLRYARIMDSSIWNYYVRIPFTDVPENETRDASSVTYDFDQLEYAVKNIIRYSKDGLYNLAISHEYADLHARLLQQSYLSTSEGHGKAVAPFLFHQEQEMRKGIDKYIQPKWSNENNEDEEQSEEDHRQTTLQNLYDKKIPWTDTVISKYKWRILLLDDHALDPMNPYDANEKNTTSRPDKLRIISNTLRRVFLNINIGYVDYNHVGRDATIKDEQTRSEVGDRKYDIVFYCVSNITNAETALKEHKFEIVLLDYLLGKKGSSGEKREYSYSLLEKIYGAPDKTKNSETYKFGPHKRMYFMFISSFATAVNERLLAAGLHRSEKYWHIADGACPTNTPYLFLYRLLHLMHKRVKDMGIDKLSGINTKDEFKDSYIYKDIINKIYGEKSKKSEGRDTNKIGNVRRDANEHFDDVLSLLYHYKRMLEDYHKPEETENIFLSTQSTLATDFVDNNYKLGGFLEHLTQLVYLTAFGTVRQWPEMWEEYQFIRSITGERIESIEEHIYNLKTNS